MSETADVADVGRWVMTCGCGNEIRQKDLAYVGSAAPCDFCRQIMAGEDDMFDRPSVCGEMGWCACGNPEDVDALMLRYLESVPRWEHPECDLPGDVALLLAYIADAAGWTEHGGSVGGAWLTAEGETARNRLRSLMSWRVGLDK